MILSIAVILVVGVIAYIWASRGFFSALIHMVCTLIAGAIAFGVWEPLAYWLLDLLNNQGDSYVGMVWGVSLGLPFAIALAALRLGIDALLPANAELDGVTNLVGGGVCGFVSGTITAGMIAISMSYLWLPSEFMSYQAISFAGNGSPKRESKLIYPADRITGWFYSFMSEAGFRTSTPMAYWRPSVVDNGHLMRMTFNTGGARHTLTPKAFDVTGRYTLDGPKGKDLLTDAFDPDRKQTVTDLDESPMSDGVIEGFVVTFKAGAREKQGGVVIGNGQIELVYRDADDTESKSAFPIAVVSQAEGSSPDLGRWRYDSGGSGTFIRSAGASSEVAMGFEFLIPRGAKPLALYVKGVRCDVTEMAASQQFATTAARDASIKSGNILAGKALGTAGELDKSGAITIAVNPEMQESEVFVNSRIQGRSIISKDNLAGIEIDDSNHILSADSKFNPKELNDNRGISRNLQVTNFVTGEDAAIFQLKVDVTSRIGMLSAPASQSDMSQPPVLIDTNKVRYAAIGWVYKDNQEVHIRFTPGKPITSASELPALSKSRPDQSLVLLYRVSQGVEIEHFTIGNKVIGTFKPAVKIKRD